MSGTIGSGPIPQYIQYAANETKYAAQALKASPTDNALLTYFKANAASITTPAQLLGNYKVLEVVLSAFNLQGSIKNTAILQQLMTQDPTSKTSLSARLGNAQYTRFAKAFSDWTTSPFASATNVATIAQSYTTNTFEQSADAASPGLANALYWSRLAPAITSISQLQSDPTLLKVAVATTGITYDQYVALDFAQQTKLLTASVKISQLTTPSYVNRVAEQYLIQNGSSGASAPPPGSIASLYSDTSDTDAGDSLLGILDPSANLADDSSSGGALSLFA
jgi:hypothetical protein